MHDHCEEEGHCNEHEDGGKSQLVISIFGVIVYVFAIILSNSYYSNIDLIFYIISYILLGYKILINAVKRLFKKDMFDENFLMSIATIGAFIVGEYEEAVAVLLFYKVGEFLQDLAVEKSKEKIKSAIDLRPEYATLYKDGKEEKVFPIDVKVGDIIIVKTGEKIPLDGKVIKGETLIDNSALTGESKPVSIKAGDNILSGTINLGAVIKVEVIKNYESSMVYKIIDMTTEAQKSKSNTEKFITKFAKIYTPIVTLLALIIFITFPLMFGITYADSAFRALTFLVVSCPCALVISIPLGFFVGVGISSKNNILIKGTNYLDIMSKVDTFVFDKTGTLTTGTFEIVKKNVYNRKITENELLEYIAYAESFSNHYLAKSVLNNIKFELDKSRVTKHSEISGMGIEVKLDDKNILVGNEKFMKKNDIKYELEETTGTIIHLAVDNVYYGNIILEDSLKESSANLVDKLKKNKIKKVYLLTGDNVKTASKIGETLKIDGVYHELLPNQKSDILKEIKNEGKTVAYVGDGINDGPVIASADVGISMGDGSDLAVETSNVVILNNDLNKLIDLIKISKRTKKIIMQNILLILFVKVMFLILSGIGISSMWHAVFADVGISIISILNSLRIYGYSSRLK